MIQRSSAITGPERYTVGLPNHRNSSHFLPSVCPVFPCLKTRFHTSIKKIASMPTTMTITPDRIAAFSAHAAVVVCGHFGSGERDHRPEIARMTPGSGTTKPSRIDANTREIQLAYG